MDAISDNWDQQIACVLAGHKKVAMTDYDQFREDSEVQYYYEITPKDVHLRQAALNCGIKMLQSSEGTEFYFRPEYQINALILINHYNGVDPFPSHLYTSIQALLLGYSDVSIILYDLFQQMVPLIYEKIPPGTGQTLNIQVLSDQDKFELTQIYLVSLPGYILLIILTPSMNLNTGLMIVVDIFKHTQPIKQPLKSLEKY